MFDAATLTTSLAIVTLGRLRRVRTEKTVLGGVPCEWIVAVETAPDAPVVVHLHGGGWAYGGVDTHRAILCRLAIATGARVLAPEYRLAPEHPFPAAIEDAMAVVRSLGASGVPAARIVLSGDSAGGNVGAATLLSLRDAGDPLPAAAVLICPVVDLEACGGSMESNAPYDWITPASVRLAAEVYVARHAPSDPLASPLRAELRGLPPLLVQVGDAELLFDQARAFAERARAARVEVELDVYPGMTHVWHAFAPAIPALEPAFGAIGRFVRKHVVDQGAARVTAQESRGSLPAS